MRWLEIIVVIVTLQMLTVLRAWKRSGRGVRNSPPSSRSSLPTVQNPNSVADADPARIVHDGACEHCSAQVSIPLARTRLERAPWRLVWWCEVCGQQARATCPEELVGMFTRWDHVGGMGLSMREVADMVGVSLEEVNRAIEDEIL